MTEMNLRGPTPHVSTGLKFNQYVGTYLNVLEAAGRNIRTIRGYRKRLKDFSAWITDQGLEHVDSITEGDVREYLNHLREANEYRPATVNAMLTAIKAYCSWLRDEGLIQHNPAEGIQSQARDVPPRWLNKNERHWVLRQAKQMDLRNQPIIWLLLLAGLRGEELIHLRPDDVIATGDKGSLVIRGSHSRIVPIHPEVRPLLSRYVVEERSTSDWLFGSQRGDKLTLRAVQYICSDVGGKAGVPDLTPQVLRHTFGHNLVSSGIPLHTVAAIMGLPNIASVLPYFSDEDREKYDRQQAKLKRIYG